MNNPVDTHTGWQRFDYFLQPLQTILQKASETDNPAFYLYNQNARTPLFMLEALSRIYNAVGYEKLFFKLDTRFKELEDMLGEVDYYDGFYKEFTAKKNMPAGIIDFIQKKRDNSLTLLNKKLNEENWLGQDSKRLKKIRKRLLQTDWLNEKDEMVEIAKYYKESINQIEKNIRKNKISFRDVETDVHELRRKLRWLSIYPQALRGLIQLQPTKDAPGFLNKYLSDEIVNSSFNKMPDGSALKEHIILSRDYFYALSWMIAELGKLKDNGLRILVVKEALTGLKKLKDKEAAQEAFKLCGIGQMTLNELLAQAKKISEQFFADEILGHLLLN